MSLHLRNQKGQSLIEYLIIVAVIAIGSIAIVRALGETINVRFANITNALQGKNTNLTLNPVERDSFKKRGLDDFFKGAGDNGSGSP